MERGLQRPDGSVSGYLDDALAYANASGGGPALAAGASTGESIEGMEIDLRKGVKTRSDKDGFEKGCSRNSGCKPIKGGGCSLQAGCNPQRTYSNQEAKQEDAAQKSANVSMDAGKDLADEAGSPKVKPQGFEIPKEPGMTPEIENIDAGFQSQADVTDDVQLQDSAMNTIMSEIKAAKDFYSNNKDIALQNAANFANTVAGKAGLEGVNVSPDQLGQGIDTIQDSDFMNSDEFKSMMRNYYNG